MGNRDWLVCTSASAGPAFEGGGIEFGMRAAKGAIEDFSLDPATCEPMIATIGNAVAGSESQPILGSTKLQSTEPRSMSPS